MELLMDLQPLLDLMDAEKMIRIGGLLAIVLIVFAENGILFGVFLPGDSLLFTAGLLCAVGILDVSIAVLLLSIITAGIAGNFSGYYFGYISGKAFFSHERKDTFFFKRKYVEMTESFYNKYGARAIIFGRFLPIIRTFVPFLAGAIKFDFKEFVLYNIIGAVVWASAMVLAGFFLGVYVPGIKEYLEPMILLIIIITIIPTVITYFKHRTKKID